ncbi:MAG: hypothetical protein ISS47_01680 [Candidatus Omnitrophica bacterium]|nr:hypothetical protein [Candidatus Omnitrophota bacterium]
MNIIGLFISTVVGVIFLVIHSYFTRGSRLTLTFFPFAFIVAFNKEFSTFLKKSSPFFFPGKEDFFILSILTVVIGWIVVFYLGWSIAEKIIKRVDFFQDKIFPTLLFAGIIIACICYAIEATAINIGWWQWFFFDKRFTKFLVGGVHFFALEAWFYFAIHFLATYFLIEYSKYKKKDWKCIFFLIFFMRMWTIIFFKSELPRVIEEWIALSLLFILSFLSRLRFEFSDIKLPKGPKFLTTNQLEAIPLLVIIMITAILAILDIAEIKEIQLLITILPILFFVLLAIEKIPLSLVVISTLALVVFGGAKMIPVLVPVATLVFFNIVVIINQLGKKNKLGRFRLKLR